ncbi:ATP-binding protein [Postechiella marina]|uniref:histidine kinase n=1 Tax=Postechiella marina TaxID=943941 RepID=A0ABP8CAX3_9FLAO
MKTCLITCFLLFSNVAISQSDRRLIKEIDSLNNSAILYYTNNQILESFIAFNKVKKKSDSIQDNYGRAISNLYLGNIYSLMYEYVDAKRSYKTMLQPASAINDNYLLGMSYLNLGKLANQEKSPNEALIYLEKAKKYSVTKAFLSDNNYTLEKKHDLIQQIGIALSEFYINNNYLDKALLSLLHFNTSLDASPRLSYYAKGYHSYLKGLYLLKKEMYSNAIIKFEEALLNLNKSDLSKHTDSDLLFSKIYKHMASAYAFTEDKGIAYLFLLKYNDYHDSYLNTKKDRHEVIDKSKFLIEDYKNEVQIANSEKLYQSQIAKKTKNVNFVMAMALFFLGVALVAIYFNYISKRKLANVLEKRNDQLELDKDEALKSSQLKSKFISNVTHELRTPLYGVVGITSLLLANNNLSNKDSKYLKSLKYSGDYLLRLINEVLEFGKIESDKIELKKVSVELKPLLENIIGSFDYKLKETNNKIHLNMDNRLPKYIMCDNVRLSQVLINLIGNSVKFTSNGDIFVTVIVRNINNDNNNVDLRFEVEDNGTGIPKEKFKSIFDDFSQLENSNLSYKGTGLGLTITKKIIELFESKIELESEYGSGSKFSFNVNFEIDTEGFEKAKNKIIQKKVRSLNNSKILIAEDNKINQIVTKNLLEKANYYCEIVENGVEAIDTLKNKPFDLILMDINMPVMGGIEATNLIREFNSNIPILALTAADIEDFKENEKYISFNGLITKPFDNYEFFQLIESNIQHSKKGTLFQRSGVKRLSV